MKKSKKQETLGWEGLGQIASDGRGRSLVPEPKGLSYKSEPTKAHPRAAVLTWLNRCSPSRTVSLGTVWKAGGILVGSLEVGL